MTEEAAMAVAHRLNEMDVPTCSMDDPIFLVISRWTEEGGRLVVRDLPDGEKRIDYFHFPEPRWSS